MKLLMIVYLTALAAGRGVHAQGEPPSGSIHLSSHGATGQGLPFWMTANRNGLMEADGESYQLLTAALEQDGGSPGGWQRGYGLELAGARGRTTHFQANQYWVGLRNPTLTLKAGARSEPVRFAGLSHTNGDMLWSNNARPLPGLSLSTTGFIPAPFGASWFSYKALFEENLLWDDQQVEGAHLHHKYLYGRATLPQDWSLVFGLDHWVFWGGRSAKWGRLPGFKDYFRYIFALGGGGSAPRTDQVNASGNSLGAYRMELARPFERLHATFYWNHPFEDRSGLELANYQDGLWGVHLHLNQEHSSLQDLVYEFMNTTHQSGPRHLAPKGRGRDDYFNHDIYGSGYVHYNHMMGTPIFRPLIGPDGISRGFDNTRIRLHHLGLGGHLSPRTTWKAMITHSRSFGTYAKPFPTPRDQTSWLTEVRHTLQDSPLELTLGLARDHGELFEENFGGYAGGRWRF